MKIIPGIAGRLISRGHGIHSSRTISTWELIFVAGGRLDMFCGDVNYQVEPGGCLLLPSGVRHGGLAEYPRNLTFFWIHFTPADNDSLHELCRMPRHFTVRDQERLSGFFQMYLNVQQQFHDDERQLELILQLILDEAFKPCRATVPVELPPLLAQLDRIINLRFREPLSSSQIALEINCNPDYLGRLFRRHFHLTITERLNDLRIRHARELLTNTNKDIAAISREVGFNDTAYFRRQFFRRTAMTPLAFRKKNPPGNVNTE